MEQLSKIVQRRLQGTEKAGIHPDAGLLTAFAEKSLGDHERSQVLQHLAQCGNCREVVSLAMPEPHPEQEIQPTFTDFRWLRWPVLRWAALAACIVVAGTMATRRYAQYDRFVSRAVSPPAPQLRENQRAKDSLEAPSQAGDARLVARAEPPSPLQAGRDVSGIPTSGKAVSGPAPSAATMGAGSSTMALSKKEKTPESKGVSDAVQIPAMTEMVEVEPTPAPAQPAPSAPATSARAAGAAGQTTQRAGDIGAGAFPSSGNETVEVTAESSVVETAQLSPGKAKDSKNAPEKIPQPRADLAVEGRNYSQLVTLAPPAQWSLSAKGVVQRSVDAGKSWQPVAIADHVVFRAVSALGSEIWVGGAAGALYHSSDSGQSWVQVRLSAAGRPLTSAIITLQFADTLNGKLTTADHQTWITSDGGVSWQRQ